MAEQGYSESPLIVPGGREKPKDDEPKIVQADTAILIWRTPDGLTGVSTDINVALQVRRAPSADEIHGLCANVQKDIEAIEAADTMITKMNHIQQQAMQQAQAQQIWQQTQAEQQKQAERSRR